MLHEYLNCIAADLAGMAVEYFFIFGSEGG